MTKIRVYSVVSVPAVKWGWRVGVAAAAALAAIYGAPYVYAAAWLVVM